MKKTLLNPIVSGLIVLSGAAAQAQLVSTLSGSGINQTFTVESVGQFRLVFEAADNWGLSQWYDLVNDPTASVNVAGPLYAVNGPSVPCFAEPGLQNMVFYGDNDDKLNMRVAGCSFPGAARSMTILQNTASVVVLETTAHPMNATPAIENNITGTVRYNIYPNGQIYVHKSLSVASAQDLSSGDLFIAVMGLENPMGNGSIPPDSQGWIRATSQQNPFSYEGFGDSYVFAYWSPNTPSPYATWTKASIMLVWSPANGGPGTYSQIIHGWSSGTGYGVVRWGFRIPGPTMSAGQTLSFDFLMQLGTQSSSVLPNLTSSAAADPIANAYRANPTPPSTGSSPCDVNGDSVLSVADVQLEVNMALGISSCTNPSGQCSVTQVQRVVVAVLGGTCASL